MSSPRVKILKWVKESVDKCENLEKSRIPGIRNFFSRGWANGTSLATLIFALDASVLNLAASDQLSQTERVQECFDVVKAKWSVEPPCTVSSWTKTKRLKTEFLVSYLHSIMNATLRPFVETGDGGDTDNVPGTTENTTKSSQHPNDQQVDGTFDNNDGEVAKIAPEAGKDADSELLTEPAGQADRTDPSHTSRQSDADANANTNRTSEETFEQENQSGRPSSDKVNTDDVHGDTQGRQDSVDDTRSPHDLQVAMTKIQQLEEQLQAEAAAKTALVQSVDAMMQQLQHFRSVCAGSASGNFGPHSPPPNAVDYMTSPGSRIRTLKSPHHRHARDSSSSQFPSYNRHLRTPNDFGHSGVNSSTVLRRQQYKFHESSGRSTHRPTSGHRVSFQRENFPPWEEAFRDPVPLRTPASGTPPPCDLTLELQAEINAASRKNRWAEDRSALLRPPSHSWNSFGAPKNRATASENFFKNAKSIRTPLGTAQMPNTPALDSDDDILNRTNSNILSSSAREESNASFMEKVDQGLDRQRQHLQTQVDQLSQSPFFSQRTNASRSRSRLGESDGSVEEDVAEHDVENAPESLARSDLFDDFRGPGRGGGGNHTEGSDDKSDSLEPMSTLSGTLGISPIKPHAKPSAGSPANFQTRQQGSRSDSARDPSASLLETLDMLSPFATTTSLKKTDRPNPATTSSSANRVNSPMWGTPIAKSDIPSPHAKRILQFRSDHKTDPVPVPPPRSSSLRPSPTSSRPGTSSPPQVEKDARHTAAIIAGSAARRLSDQLKQQAQSATEAALAAAEASQASFAALTSSSGWRSPPRSYASNTSTSSLRSVSPVGPHAAPSLAYMRHRNASELLRHRLLVHGMPKPHSAPGWLNLRTEHVAYTVMTL